MTLHGEASERLTLQDAVRLQVVEHPGLEAEEAAVHPPFKHGLLLEPRDATPSVHLRDPELAAGPDDRHRGEVAVAPVELDQ
jgi:hypothetical protein